MIALNRKFITSGLGGDTRSERNTKDAADRAARDARGLGVGKDGKAGWTELSFDRQNSSLSVLTCDRRLTFTAHIL